ncbi:hypothetical protein GCM10023093_20390 [Nemorincola caseinilytica]|uniref:Peptidase S74 domain-containing protein n=2 Tax=Nemorincola caseinilytica TaxID=2054315 RepID=A0ABP8NF99_9BACT
MHGGYTGGYNSVAIGTDIYSNGAEANGANSLALGAHVTAMHEGSFAFGDHSSSYPGTATTSDNQMMMRFAGGYKLYSDADATVGAQIAPGGNSWSTISDRRKKENFTVVNGEEFLDKISKFRLTSWNYKGQDPKLYRHYGPMAQDFYAAFGHDKYGTVGNDTTINQADMEGVSFVAIQALEKRTRDMQAEIDRLTKENTDLRKENKVIVNNNEAILKDNATLKAEINDRMQNMEALLRKANTATR